MKTKLVGLGFWFFVSIVYLVYAATPDDGPRMRSGGRGGFARETAGSDFSTILSWPKMSQKKRFWMYWRIWIRTKGGDDECVAGGWAAVAAADESTGPKP